MSATYMHIGIPITNRKPNMTYNPHACIPSVVTWKGAAHEAHYPLLR